MENHKTKRFFGNLIPASKETKLERLELRDIKTLDALVSESKTLKGKVQKQYKDMLKKGDDLKAWNQMVKNSEKFRDEQLKESEKIMKRIEDLKDLRKSNEKAGYDRYNDAVEKRDEAVIMEDESAQILKVLDSKADALLDEMDREITALENGAKGLGIDISGKLSKYNSARDSLADTQGLS